MWMEISVCGAICRDFLPLQPFIHLMDLSNVWLHELTQCNEFEEVIIITNIITWKAAALGLGSSEKMDLSNLSLDGWLGLAF